ncbi:hypothetical protein CONCODRAFT_79726 [Conidiobolus coronatus NRRL 28638]|uniref:Uncharacterized protein n=1 Tax=Conidiobolus coronatus (strain ATCC 28846 / CBS 209.66 / NRRL 28638) TaxID=796925 RepID=A0A137P0I7_CONC2|nr:hypothetical protein CONCODRAFT_79726 [Conidiobolus coronatus NRRL 28638]|eukprot:KXN68488.1 hypothetical protein CONCODRAFT_79726 [Conidiobolus coronatus NRRL 28638]
MVNLYDFVKPTPRYEMYAHANLKRKNIEGSTIESASANQNPQFNQQINLQNNYNSEDSDDDRLSKRNLNYDLPSYNQRLEEQFPNGILHSGPRHSNYATRETYANWSSCIFNREDRPECL